MVCGEYPSWKGHTPSRTCSVPPPHAFHQLCTDREEQIAQSMSAQNSLAIISATASGGSSQQLGTLPPSVAEIGSRRSQSLEGSTCTPVRSSISKAVAEECDVRAEVGGTASPTVAYMPVYGNGRPVETTTSPVGVPFFIPSPAAPPAAGGGHSWTDWRVRGGLRGGEAKPAEPTTTGLGSVGAYNSPRRDKEVCTEGAMAHMGAGRVVEASPPDLPPILLSHQPVLGREAGALQGTREG